MSKHPVLGCAGCDRPHIGGGGERKLINLSCCEHSVHVGTAERACDLALFPQYPFFQAGLEFACVRSLSVGEPESKYHESPIGQLCCPRCFAVLSEHDVCLVLGSKALHIRYGESRQASLVVRQAVADLVKEFAPQHWQEFQVVEQSSTSTAASLKQGGVAKIKSMIDYYRVNPQANMDASVMQLIFDFNLDEKDQEMCLGWVAQMFDPITPPLPPVTTTGTGYGGDGTACSSTANATLQGQQREKHAKIQCALDKLTSTLITCGKDKLGVATEALLGKNWGVLSCLREHLDCTDMVALERDEPLYQSLLDLCVVLADNLYLSSLLLSRPSVKHVTKWSAESAVSKTKHSQSTAAPATTTSNMESVFDEVALPALKDSIANFVPLLSNPLLAKRCLALLEANPHPLFFTHQAEEQADFRLRAVAQCNNPNASEAQRHSPYRQLMRKYQFRLVSFADLGMLPAAATAAATAAKTKEWVRALNGTLANLRAALPVEWSSSIFCCVDERHADLLSFLIIGPEGTEYENGCFHFDMTLPSTFPQVPPQVVFRTTGGGAIRFNPNLYNSGKVCLSLLGTWPGPSWNPHESTVLQVMLSIQSLVLCREPFYNEPGYERPPNGAEDERSLRYSANIRLSTLREAMLHALQDPPKGFEQVVIDHFTLKYTQVQAQLLTWEQACLDSKYLDRAAFAQLRGEFEKALRSRCAISNN
ncbi:hypothetical protein BASA81_007920 [Batrachochytrium salamandrivorans]|nr:hypothetical protein BASA81_007920 [Batrachochytrium salamandrivorans]